MSTEPRVLAGRYRVDELIGHGGMAKVYRGYDLTLGRAVAIKILDPELARDTAFRTRFRLEAQSASRMSHPSIVRVFDAGDEADAPGSGTVTPYIVMELIHGTLLKDIISSGPVPVDDAVRYVDGILEALDYSHRAGVVHRDIKPGNVMVTEKGQVKVMDFGIARAVSDSSSTVAETTQIIGTAAYFSPEQAKGEPVDARADLYSTGVVLYELLTGRQPFRGESPVAVAYQHVSETPLPPSEVNEDSPGALDPIVLRALAKDPYQRYPDAAHFRAALDAAVEGRAPSRKEIGALTSELYGPSPKQAQETARSLRQLSADTTMTRTQSGPPVAWIWAGVALLAVLLTSVLFWVVSISTPDTPSDARVVPNVVDMSSERAQNALGELDLTAKLVLESSSEIAEGNVIRTDPKAGVAVAEGDEITVYVSSGKETVVVPTLVGLSLAQAKDALGAAGLQLGTVIQRNDKSLQADTVMEASEKADAEVAPDTVINLVVASGRVTLTDLTGWTVDAATRQLEQIGLAAQPTELTDCPATDPATVVSMSAAPGDVAIGSTVELRFCAAPAQ
ncbi:Serine/threonine-protein kinase PknB [Microbacterium hydrocarbonoxydans]|uniref:non-specific serine/threonine protein kinase n=1 Tax=Microbacterium hydrocarbonoxydans TaxID=273678 RepID=A0A0M2HUR6_9MICO|nr:Stk1 family PASTA domain-containing Ser/Thr kinase [Microbacterium hydrocarbonoxydans]KJL48198.1 Serine/threonine-protein kinase PknB [Microbacterium hydrocarbonoxydans]